MQVQVFDELVEWVNENILDDTEMEPSEIAAAAISDDEDQDTSSGLDENALLYAWCPRRKRLVRSN